jgi:ABC-type nitrate/sulfonate/bicarbonate transport system ATPase subunit
MQNLSSWRSNMNRKMMEFSLTNARIKEEKRLLAEAQENYKAAKAAQEHLQLIAQQTQEYSHKQIARVVSRCLTAVFDEPIELRIEFERKRGRTEAKFIYLKDGWRINPRTSSGGMMDVAALALRLTALTLALPPARKVLILDEPFAHIAKSRLEKMAVLIESLSHDLGVQIVMCTHDQALQVGRVIDL